MNNNSGRASADLSPDPSSKSPPRSLLEVLTLALSWSHLTDKEPRLKDLNLLAWNHKIAQDLYQDLNPCFSDTKQAVSKSLAQPTSFHHQSRDFTAYLLNLVSLPLMEYFHSLKEAVYLLVHPLRVRHSHILLSPLLIPLSVDILRAMFEVMSTDPQRGQLTCPPSLMWCRAQVWAHYVPLKWFRTSLKFKPFLKWEFLPSTLIGLWF